MEKRNRVLNLKTIKAIMIMMAITSTSAGLLSTSPALAEAPSPSWSANTTEKGWFWGEREKWEEEQKRIKEEKKKAEQERLAQELKNEEPPEKDCKNPEQWDVTCGFVHPERNFEFSQIQYKELTKQLAMYPDDTDKVMQYQKFVWWAVDQAVLAAKTAEWNMQQNQEMNVAIDNPLSAFGIRAAGAAVVRHNENIYQEIVEQEGVLVLFSRYDCVFCQKALPLLDILEGRSGLKVYNAALDEQCLDGFEGEYCYHGDDVRNSAVNLKVAMVPDLWLYLPKDKGWIRVSSGLETLDVIESRILTFFGAAKNAAQKGLARAADSPQPAVDFSEKDIFERAKHAIGVATGAYTGENAK